MLTMLRKILLIKLLAGIFFLTSMLTLSTSVKGEEFDYSRSAQQKDSPNQVRNLTNQVVPLKTLQSKSINQFETDLLGSSPVWIIAANHKILISRGNQPDFNSTKLSVSKPSKIINLDLFTFPRKNSQALITISFLTGSTLRTDIHKLTIDNDNLKQQLIQKSSGALVRPIGDLLYGQSFSKSMLWSDQIKQYKTEAGKYRPGTPLKFPVQQARLLTLTSLSDGKWIMINPEGNLHLMTRSNILDTISGNYGMTGNSLETKRLKERRPEKAEAVRLKPVYIPSKNIVATADNPGENSGLGQLFSGGNSGRDDSNIDLFQVDGTLAKYGSLGPLNGKIVDLEVPEANPDQLLWIRQSEANQYKLEMIDFSSLQ